MEASFEDAVHDRDEVGETNELKAYAVVEFPGFLKDAANPQTAISAIGGEESIRAKHREAPNEYGFPLRLSLRPGTVNSSANISGETNKMRRNMFVLELLESPDTSSAAVLESSMSLGSGARNNGRIRSPIEGTFVGQVTFLTRFTSLSDFQYHSDCPERLQVTSGVRQSEIRNSPVESAVEVQCASHRERTVESESLFHAFARCRPQSSGGDVSVNLDRLRPAQFSRSKSEHGTSDYWFRQYGAKTEAGIIGYMSARAAERLGEDRRSDINRLKTLSHRISIDTDKVPSCAPPDEEPQMVRTRAAFDSLFSILSSLFQTRPVWLRRALYEGIPTELKNNFKRVLQRIAYCFHGSGPFYQAWIRYGFDPRKDPDSRKYQVVEVRCSEPIIREAGQYQAEKETDAWESIGDHFRLSAKYSLSRVPATAMNFVQICDVKLQPVIAFCDELATSNEFDKKYGFFTENSYQKLVSTIKTSLIAKSIDILGRDRVLELDRNRKAMRSGVMERKRRRERLRNFAHSERSPLPSKHIRSTKVVGKNGEGQGNENGTTPTSNSRKIQHNSDDHEQIAVDRNLSENPDRSSDEHIVRETESSRVASADANPTSDATLDFSNVEAYQIFGDEEGDDGDVSDEGNCEEE